VHLAAVDPQVESVERDGGAEPLDQPFHPDNFHIFVLAFRTPMCRGSRHTAR